MRRGWGVGKSAVLALANGERTAAEIAEIGGFRVEYVNATLRRSDALHLVRRVKGASKPMVSGTNGFVAAKVDAVTKQAITDRANAAGKTVGEICGVLLAVAVDVGDLDTHFPVTTP